MDRSLVSETKPAIAAPSDANSAFDVGSETGPLVSSEDCKVEFSSSLSPDSSDESSSFAGSSSPESDITVVDFLDSQWEECENFSLEKYPSVEIDWAAI